MICMMYVFSELDDLKLITSKFMPCRFLPFQCSINYASSLFIFMSSQYFLKYEIHSSTAPKITKSLYVLLWYVEFNSAQFHDFWLGNLIVVDFYLNYCWTEFIMVKGLQLDFEASKNQNTKSFLTDSGILC